MENLKQLKETAEARIMSVVRELERMQGLYGLEGINVAIEALQDIRGDLLVDLDEINKEPEVSQS